MIEIESILKKAEQYDVITFDVFDTLIIRDVRKPADIFRITYGELGRYLRVIAEIIARKTTKKEVSLKDIDRFFLLKAEREIETEKQFCRANPVIQKVVNRLIGSGKQVFAISDMYLDDETLSGILKKSGYDIPLMVSCKYGCTKKEGKLFNEFLTKYGFSPDKVLHIGDDFLSDVSGVKKAGIESLHIEKDVSDQAHLKSNLKNIEYTSFIDHGLNGISDPVTRMGYEIVGPIILSFCNWVHEKKKEFGFDRLFFLSRDMRMVYDVYREMYGDDEACYLRISRKSLAYAKDNPDDFIEYLKKEKCFGNCAIVDTGWVGIAQVEIEKYCKMIDSSTDLGGLYMGTKKAYTELERSARSDSYFYKTGYERFKCASVTSFWESLIGSNESRVIAYHDGSAVLEDTGCSDERGGIGDGARAFIKDWVSIKNNKALERKYVRASFERLFYRPTVKDMNELGGLCYEDVIYSDIISYDKKCNYILNPRKFVKDLRTSAWKGAFFKNTGVFYPLLLSIYCLIAPLSIYKLDKSKFDKTAY